MVAQVCKNDWIAHFKRVNFMACKLYLNKAVLKKESEWKRGLTYWPYSFYKTPHSINYYFHKELSAPYYFSSAFCLFFVWFYFYGLQHWFTHFQSYSLPYFLIIHYLLCREIYSMCSSDFHHLFNSFFLHVACLFVSLWEQGERDVNLCDVFMSLCI